MKRGSILILLLGEIMAFFLATALVLTRYGATNFQNQFLIHLYPLLIVLAIWILVFFIANLYTYKALGGIVEISQKVIASLSVGFVITISVFYIFSRFFELTPKANLVAITLLFGSLDIGWRYALRKIFASKKQQRKVLLISDSPLAAEIVNQTSKHPQIGYSVKHIDNAEKIIDILAVAEIIVADSKALKEAGLISKLYKQVPRGVEIMSLAAFYEKIFSRIPTDEIYEEWFISEMSQNKYFYDFSKKVAETIVSIVALIVLSPFIVVFSVLIKITSPGPIIYIQERLGKNHKRIKILKLRTMRSDIEGPLFTKENDERVTTFGRFLRKTHLDEAPQLINVIKGDLSFVGPRPERTELAQIYSAIPYYEIRQMVKPGIIGWAQLNYKPSANIEEAKTKFEFDLYYIKNRSFILDIFIALKTIRAIF